MRAQVFACVICAFDCKWHLTMAGLQGLDRLVLSGVLAGSPAVCTLHLVDHWNQCLLVAHPFSYCPTVVNACASDWISVCFYLWTKRFSFAAEEDELLDGGLASAVNLAGQLM